MNSPALIEQTDCRGERITGLPCANKQAAVLTREAAEHGKSTFSSEVCTFCIGYGDARGAEVSRRHHLHDVGVIGSLFQSLFEQLRRQFVVPFLRFQNPPGLRAKTAAKTEENVIEFDAFTNVILLG